MRRALHQTSDHGGIWQTAEALHVLIVVMLHSLWLAKLGYVPDAQEQS